MSLKEKSLRARTEELKDLLMEEMLQSDTPSQEFEVLYLLGLEHLAEIALVTMQYVDIPPGIWHAIAGCDQACCSPPRLGEEQYLVAIGYQEHFVKEAEKHFEAEK